MPRVVIRDPPEMTRAQVKQLVLEELDALLERRSKARARLELGAVMRCDARIGRLVQVKTHNDWREYDAWRDRL